MGNFCGKCGVKIEEGTKYCSECGNEIGYANTDNQNPVTEKRKRKKTWLIAVVIILFVAAGVAILYINKNYGTGTDKAGLTGESDDKTVDTEETANSEKKAVIKTVETSFSRTEFDEYGNEIYYTYSNGGATTTDWEYAEDGTPVKAYKYDETGRLIGSTEYLVNGRFTTVIEKTYDADGNEESKISGVYTYDENGNPKEYHTFYFSGNEMRHETVMYWDELWETYKTSYEIWYDKGNIEDYTYYEYNEYGNTCSCSVVRDDGDVEVIQYEYVYNENGDVIEARSWDVDNPEDVTIYTYKLEYDMRGNVVANYMYREDGTLFSNNFYTYYE